MYDTNDWLIAFLSRIMVKLRLKFGKETFRIECVPGSGSEAVSLSTLITHISQHDELKGKLHGLEFALSLNGTDVLTEPEKSLHDHGIVSGDLVRILASTNEDASKSSKVKTYSSPGVGSEGSLPSTSKSVTEEKNEEVLEQNFDEEGINDEQAYALLNEPVLIREVIDGSLPQSLILLYENTAATNLHEALFVAMHLLMLETGFGNTYQRNYMPDKWRKAGGVFKTEYTTTLAPDSTVTLTYVTLGNVANVFCTVSSSDLKFQHKFKIIDYITSVYKDAAKTYKQLPKLSTVFKDKISYPILQSLTSDTSQVPSLNSLMTEVQLLILKHLSAADLIRLALVNQHFSVLCKEPWLWRRLYMKDFGRKPNNNDLSQDWFKSYKERYQQRKEQRRIREEMMRPPPFRDPYADPYPLYPGSNYPPGFVGGDYDRDPAFGGIPGVFGPGAGGRNPLALPRPRFDPIGPHPGGRDPLRPPLPGWGPRRPNNRRDPFFGGGGGFGFM